MTDRDNQQSGLKAYPYRERLTALGAWAVLLVVASRHPFHYVAADAILSGAIALAILCGRFWRKGHPFWFLMGTAAGAWLVRLLDLWHRAYP